VTTDGPWGPTLGDRLVRCGSKPRWGQMGDTAEPQGTTRAHAHGRQWEGVHAAWMRECT
jgi:hypothetical protein